MKTKRIAGDGKLSRSCDGFGLAYDVLGAGPDVVLLESYHYPADHWVHLRTTCPIESTFATVRHLTEVTKGPGSRVAGLAMTFRLIEAAQSRWGAVNAPHLVALVRAGSAFHHGKLVVRPADNTNETEEVMVV